jgi:hypothetical protein
MTPTASEAVPSTAAGLGWPLTDGVPSGGLGWPAPVLVPDAAGEESA